MYLLNLVSPTRPRADLKIALHSTMYLLNRDLLATDWEVVETLHSTMYLLNRENKQDKSGAQTHFTFHNVSIKSRSVLVHTGSRRLYIPQCIY